jgi:hypothetical protein
MMNLTAHHLRLTLAAETPLELDEHQGGALRGMLFNALRGPQRRPELGFCTQRHLTACAGCALVAVCPVASLVATLNPQAERGRDVPRPYAIVPPLEDKQRYAPGEHLTFGLTLFGQALNLFPYVVMALHQAGPGGLGRKLPVDSRGRYRRGQFSLHSARAVNLLTGETQDVLQAGSPVVQQPSLPVTQAEIEAASSRLLSELVPFAANGRHGGSFQQQGQTATELDLTLHFRTPTRLIEQTELLKEPRFGPLFHRLLDRLVALSREFAAAPAARPPEEAAPTLDKAALLALADSVSLTNDQTRWQELWSFSARQKKTIPIGGLLGSATYRAPRPVWSALLPYLLWGTVTNIGKNAVKGDGVIAVSG